MPEPVARCGICNYPVSFHDDFCWRCGSLISLDDLRAVYDAEEPVEA